MYFTAFKNYEKNIVWSLKSNVYVIVQVLFNRAHIRTRSGIERGFGWWKKRFNCLPAEIRKQPERVCKIIMACALLHNILRLR
jgi:hypothetical protein